MQYLMLSKAKQTLLSSVAIAIALSVSGCSDSDSEPLPEPTPLPTPEPTPSPVDELTVAIDFSKETSWEAGFADFPTGGEQDYEMAYESESAFDLFAGGSDIGYMLTSHNRSDDVIMFVKGQVEGLSPNTWYKVAFDAELASNVGSDMCSGIGGSPAALTVKVGASAEEPQTVVESRSEDFNILNMDIGHQTKRGYDALVVGDIGIEGFENCDSGFDKFALKSFDTSSQDFRVKADNDGKVWLLLATDSGYEGKSVVYFTDVVASFSRVTEADISEQQYNFVEASHFSDSIAYDYPQGREIEWEITSESEQSYLDIAGVWQQGHMLHFYNRSDDTGLFVVTPLQGLEPEQSYQATFTLGLATNVMDGCFGIGGAPDSVAVKAGVSGIKPDTSSDEGETLRLNLDVGQQMNGGASAALMGKIGSSELEDCDPSNRYFAQRIYSGEEIEPIAFTADDEGMAWVFFGIESGFEGPTTVFLTDASIRVSKAE